MRTFCPFCKSTIEVPPRPKSVTVISWIFIVLGAVMLIALIKNPADWFPQGAERHSVYYILAYLRIWAGPILAILCGVSMLRGLNWARWLLVLWFGNNILGAISAAHGWQPRLSMLSAMLLFGVVMLLLFRPAATSFFLGPPPAPSKPENPPAPKPEPATGRDPRPNDV